MTFFAKFHRTAVLWILCAVLVLVAVVVTVFLALKFAPSDLSVIRFDRTEITFHTLSDTYRLQVETEPEGASAESLIWSSSDVTVATVSPDGTVTAKKNGTALITAVGERGTGKGECRVKVCAVTGLDITEGTEVSVPVGYSRTLQYRVEPADAEISMLRWTSSDPEIASVDGYGKVTARSVGTVTVILSTADGTYSDSCIVSVTEKVPIQGLRFDVTEFTFRTPEDKLILTPVFTPDDTSQRELQWMSTNELVATVDPLTGEVTALSNGTAEIVAKSLYGEYVASCAVTVDQSIPLKGIQLSHSSYTFSGLGQVYLIEPVFNPVNASNKTVLWKSSDPSVATVSSTGVVTSVKKGEAVIYLETQEGGYKAEFKISVAPNDRISVTGLTLSDYSVVFDMLGQTKKLTASVKPANASEKGVRFQSKNTSVAMVSSDGTVIATGYGTTQIVATSVDGNYSELCSVTVNAPVVEEPSTGVETAYVKGVWVATVANIDFPS